VTKEVKQGIKQSLGISLYCATIGSVMSNADTFFGKQDTFMTPILVLTMFSVSVLICALIVFKKPYELFFDGKKKEAINVVVYTAESLFVILILLFVAMSLLK
jgi:hypothetical protein